MYAWKRPHGRRSCATITWCSPATAPPRSRRHSMTPPCSTSISSSARWRRAKTSWRAGRPPRRGYGRRREPSRLPHHRFDVERLDQPLTDGELQIGLEARHAEIDGKIRQVHFGHDFGPHAGELGDPAVALFLWSRAG